ncbi:MAG: molybdopterin cofactor-binding domain-containing protein, partial [Persicimonas sp.]
MNRREFLRVSLLGSGAFLMGVSLPGCLGADQQRMRDVAASSGAFQPNAVVAVTPDDRVLVAVGKSEMGQGVFTHHAMLVAEELGVDLEQVEPFHAEAGPEFQIFGVQQTGGSSSTAQTYKPVRRAAAAAREMFISAAAATWGCARGDCEAHGGAIHRTSTGDFLRYGALTQVAAGQSIPDDAPLKAPSEFEIIGQSKPRVDLEPKVDGSAEYGLDIHIDGMVEALVIRPPVLGAQVASFDAGEAAQMRGVVDIFAFDRGVAVVADKYWQARRAAPHVEVEWTESSLDGFNTSEMRDAARRRDDAPAVTLRDDGDVDRGLDDADMTVVEATYEAPYLAHAPLEPQNGTAYVQEDRVDIWAPVQWQSAAQGDVATLLGLPREDVHVHTTMLGGGFGRRLLIDYIIEAVLVSREIGRPVRVVWTREDDTRGGYYRPFSHTRVRGAVDADGRPVAFDYHTMSQSLLQLDAWLPSILPEWMPRLTRTMMGKTAGNVADSDSLPNMLATEGASDLTYAVPNIRVGYTQIRVDVPVSFWRSVGHSFNAFAVESFIDELAAAADRDPYEVRRELLTDDPRKLGVLDRAAELGGWGSPVEEGFGRGIAVHKSFGTYCAQVIEAGVFDDEVVVRRVSCAVDCGLALNPDIVVSQMESCIAQGLSAAIMQKIDFVDGRVVQGNFDTFGFIRMHEAPQIDVEIIDSDAPPTGVGEPGLPPVAPALAGGIFD